MNAQGKLFITLVFVLTATFTLTADPIFNKGNMIINIKSYTHSIGVQLANLQKQRTHLSIVDVNGKSWYSQVLWKENGYAKELMLTGMPEGIYILFIKNKKESYTQAFAKTDFDIAFFTNPSDVDMNEGLALFTSNNGSAKGTMITKVTVPEAMNIGIQLANLQGSEVNIQLNTLGGTAILKDYISGEIGYAKRFNVNGMSRGVYYFLIRSEKSTQIQFFTISHNGLTLNKQQMLKGSSSNSRWALK